MDLDGSALRNQTGSTGVTRARFAASFRRDSLVGGRGAMVVDVDLEGSGLKRCRAFFFCGQALPSLPSMQTRKAVCGDNFDWCVCVCVCVCVWFAFGCLAHDLLVIGRRA